MRWAQKAKKGICKSCKICKLCSPDESCMLPLSHINLKRRTTTELYNESTTEERKIINSKRRKSLRSSLVDGNRQRGINSDDRWHVEGDHELHNDLGEFQTLLYGFNDEQNAPTSHTKKCKLSTTVQLNKPHSIFDLLNHNTSVLFHQLKILQWHSN